MLWYWSHHKVYSEVKLDRDFEIVDSKEWLITVVISGFQKLH